MDKNVDVTRLAAAVRQRRGDRGLRAAAQEIGNVSAATLSRVEQGKLPDLDTFVRLCRWLGVSANDFLPPDVERARKSGTVAGTPEMIAAHLRADKTLSPKTAEALGEMVRLAYEAAAQGKLKKARRG